MGLTCMAEVANNHPLSLVIAAGKSSRAASTYKPFAFKKITGCTNLGYNFSLILWVYFQVVQSNEFWHKLYKIP